MKRTTLIILGVAGAFVVLVLVAAAIAVATIDPRALMGPILARIEAATGRTVTVAGPVRFHLSLTPSISLDNVAFANAPWGRAKDLLVAGRIEASVALLPLIHRRFDIVEVRLSHPVIALETDAAGHGNWQFGPSRESSASAADTAAAAGAATAIGVSSVVIDDGEVSYRDGATGNVTAIGIDHLALHAANADAPVAVDFRGKVGSVPVAVNGDLGPVSAWLAERWPYAVALDGSVGGTPARVHGKLSRAGRTTTLDDVDVRWSSLAAAGKVVATDLGHGVTRLALEPLHTFGGTVAGTVTLASAPGAAPRIDVDVSAQDLDLAAIARAAGAADSVRSGRMRVTARLASSGSDPEAWVTHLSGSVLAVAGPTALAGAAGGSGSALARVAGFLDPTLGSRGVTELQCAVVRLPIADGVARVDRSIGAETKEIGVLASGQIDFRNRTLDLAVQPTMKRGISIDISSIARLVRVRGPFAHPAIGVDAAAAAEALAGAGALAATGGGLAVLGGALIAPGGSSDEAPCAIAMSGARRGSATGSAPRSADQGGSAVANDLGKALGRLLGR
ncbi:MAG: AsmA family protein [Proteobacteria bacterium]|nr:AsmA family protein [Pseudomonadota bacterium]